MSEEFERAVAEIRVEASLENKGHTLMNNQVIEHLELEIVKRKQEVARMEQTVEEKQEELEREMERTQEREEENLKLRRLLEKSGQTTEKALKDSKRRLEESENKRKSTLEKYLQIESDLSAKLEESLQTVERCQRMTTDLENQLLKEQVGNVKGFSLSHFFQQIRKTTIDAHKAQNKKIEELKIFFKDVLSSEEGLLDEVIRENRNAVFAHLALIVSRIPIVR